jgi:signal transduction histidine kinase
VSNAFQNLLTAIRADVQWREEFIATLTHDLKVPLLATQQTLSYLQKGAYGPVNDTLLEVLAPLKQANGFSLDLIATLLDLYTYEAGKQTLRPELTQVWPLLNGCFEEAAPLAVEKNIVLTLNPLPEGILANAMLDALAFKRVFHNLLANAISHTPRYGSIQAKVFTSAELKLPFVKKLTQLEATTLKQPVTVADTLFILIQDSGLGIERTRMEQMFQRFGTFRQGRNPMNIGLGLYHSYKVVQAHNGLLWIETTEGEGTAVIMALPTRYPVAQEHALRYECRQAT